MSTPHKIPDNVRLAFESYAEDSRWRPMRRGPIFCAPGCGGGCTHEAFTRTVKQASALARQLGAGWVGVIEENLGWHYVAVSPDGHCTVTGHGHALLSTTSCALGGGGQWVGRGDIPIEAVHDAYRQAHAVVRAIAESMGATFTWANAVPWSGLASEES